MLTKQERAEIATRFISYDGGTLYFAELFECLFNREIPGSTTNKEDTEAVIDRLSDLCDTSNMLELPVDKDGEVIRIGDTVYDEDTKYSVIGYDISEGEFNIVLEISKNGIQLSEAADNLTHKQPVTIKSLAARIRDVLKNDYSEMSPYTSRELVHIANDLERLGDNNE